MVCRCPAGDRHARNVLRRVEAWHACSYPRQCARSCGAGVVREPVPGQCAGPPYGPGDGKAFEGVIGKELSNPIPGWAEHGAGRKVVPYGVTTDLDSP